MDRVMRRAVLAVLCVLTVAGLAPSARTAELPTGMSIVPSHPLYFVARDAFVRELPDNNAARIGQVMKGQRLTVAGKVLIPKWKGPNWLALKRPDGKIGYVFGAALVPMIDGTLGAPLEGKVSSAGRPDCRYSIVFEGRTQISGETQQTADYDVTFECAGKNSAAPLTFNAGMFITELPFDEKRAAFQINIDLWDMRVSGEDVLSVTALYDPDAKRVSFDRVNDDKLGSGKGIAPESADDVPAALVAAIKIAHQVWQVRAWETLAQLPKPDADIDPDAKPGDSAPDVDSPPEPL